MCLPLLLNLTQFQRWKSRYFLESEKIQVKLPFLFAHTQIECDINSSTNGLWLEVNKIASCWFFSGSGKCWTKSTIPKPTIRNPNAGSAAGFRLNVQPLAAESSFVFVKILLGHPGFRTLAPPKILPTVWTSFREFLPMFCQDFLLGDMPTSRWGVCFQASFLINQLGTFDASDIQRETSFKNVFSVVRGDLRNKSQIGTLDHL